MTSEMDMLRRSYGLEGSADEYLKLAQKLEAENQPENAAIAYDRAFTLAPDNDEIIHARQNILNRLSIIEHGMMFRYIPAGTFLMGSDDGDPDEQPVHPVELDAFWLSDTPVSWSTYADLMGWEPAPDSAPIEPPSENLEYFVLWQENKIRRQYCEDGTTAARDWHAHSPEQIWRKGTGETFTAQELFGDVQREDPRRPWRYDTKPMVSVSWQAAEDLCQRLTASPVRYCLPSEAQWEKAARAGLNGAKYAWGSQPPTPELCDFDHFGKFFIQRPRDLAPNGYRLFGMCGGVWEWTSDWYDAEYYLDSPPENPAGPAAGQEKVLRGGSWADCAEAVTISCRMSRPSAHWRADRSIGAWRRTLSPNIGFRLCRVMQKL